MGGKELDHRYLIYTPCHCHATYDLPYEQIFYRNQEKLFFPHQRYCSDKACKLHIYGAKPSAAHFWSSHFLPLING